MALSVHSWHSIRLSAHEGVPAGAPGPPRGGGGGGGGPGAPAGTPSWAKSLMECQEWTDKAIN